MTRPAEPLPRDGRLLALILASKGIENADDRVIHQLLDFAHRYTADVLQAAQSLSDHAARSGAAGAKIDKDDVELAVQMRKHHEFFETPPRDYLAALAHELNRQPLPILSESFEAVRLPPPHQRLAEVNFDIIPDTSIPLDAIPDDDGDSSEESDVDDVDVNGDTGEQDAVSEADEDEEMEEVGAAPRIDRPVDEDYDD